MITLLHEYFSSVLNNQPTYPSKPKENLSRQRSLRDHTLGGLHGQRINTRKLVDNRVFINCDVMTVAIVTSHNALSLLSQVIAWEGGYVLWHAFIRATAFHLVIVRYPLSSPIRISDPYRNITGFSRCTSWKRTIDKMFHELSPKPPSLECFLAGVSLRIYLAVLKQIHGRGQDNKVSNSCSFYIVRIFQP